MQFGSSRKLHHSPQETTYLPPEIFHLLPYEIINLLRRPLVFVILVWASLFLILCVVFVYAQDTGAGVKQKRAAANSGPTTARGRATATKRTATAGKTETVEIFSTGEDIVTPLSPVEARIASSRRTAAARRHIQK